MVQESRSRQFVDRCGIRFRLPFVVGMVVASLALCLPIAWSQGLQEVTPPTPFSATQVGATAQQNVLLRVISAPTSISSFSFANSQGGIAEYAVGTVTGCTVDGSTQNAVGTICTVPVTFQPAYPGPRKEPLQAATNGGTLFFGLTGTGQAAQVSLTPGILSSVAGTGVSGNSGNNGQATSATLNQPGRVAVDYQGNLFFADTGNHIVRGVVASSGVIVLLAGTGTACPTPTASCGDGGPSVNANLSNPASVAVDPAGNLYIADSGDNRIRRVDAATGIITTVAGNGNSGFTGDGGQATAAAIGNPQQVIVDSSGNLYIAAAGDNAVRYVSASSGVITTLAGNGTACAPATATCGDGGAAAGGASQLSAPTGLARDVSGDLYIADSGDNRIRRIDASTGTMSTAAGTGTAGYAGDGGAATSAELNAVHGIDIDAAGDLYLADQGSAAVRVVLSATGTISTIAGGTACSSATAACGDGGVSFGATLILPQNAALDSFGNLYIADKGENRIRRVYVVQPTFNFASVTAGFSSSDSPQNALVTNIGNASLTAASPSSGTNPAFTSGFSYDSGSSTCPLLTPSSAAATLPPGYGCIYGIDFRPPTAGSNMGSMTLTGNALNNPSATQSVLLEGTGTQIFEANTLSSSNTSPAYGASVTFTDTIPVIDNIAPTGTVSFYNGSTLLGSAAVTASGVETFSLVSLPVGTDSISATYSGDTTYASETSNAVVETVGNPANTATSTALVSSVNPTTYGQSTDLIATVSYPNGGAVPTGSVTFYSAGSSTTINLDASPTSAAYAQTLNLAAGTYSLAILGNTNGGLYAGWNPATNPSTNNRWTDRYGIELCATCTAFINDISGDPGYSTDAQAMAAFQGAATLNMTLGTASQGQTIDNPFTFTLTSPESVSLYIPDGTFANGSFSTTSFADDSGGLSLSVTPLTAVGSASVSASGIATFPTATLPAGTDPIQAVYSGDSTYVASASAVVSQVVNKAPAGGTLTSSNTSPTIGQSVTFTDTLPTVNSTYPSGTVTFSNGSTTLGTGTLTNGIATLSTSVLPLGTDTITASYPGDANFLPGTSNSVTETVGKSAGSDTLAASTTTPSFGQSVTFTDTIPVVPGIAPTGTVAFYNGTTLIGTAPVNSSGVETLTTGALPAGTDSITALYSGDANYAQVTSNALTVTVSKANGADALTTSNASPSLGQSITLTDTVPVVGGTAPTGTVTFHNGATAIGTSTVSSSGVATFTLSTLPPGADSITAVYSGDSNYASVTAGPITENVAMSAVPDMLTTSNPSIVLGQSVTFTDTVPVTGGTPPTGTVTFYNGTTAIGTGAVNASGIAALAVNSLPAGSDAITAVYPGDRNYLSANAGPLTETVAKSTSPDTLTSSNPAPSFGEPVIFTDTIPVLAGIATTGTVTFYNGSAVLGTGTVNASGVATFTTRSLPAGTDSITAVYGGDSNYAPVTSNAVVESVARASGADTLTSSNTSPVFGQPVIFTDTVPTVGGIAPTGTVTFYNGSAVLGMATISASGVATFTTSSLPAGTDSITAVYGGDSNYAPVTSNAVVENVSKAAGASALSSSNTAPSFGQQVLFTDTITFTGSVVPTGTVTFYNGTSAIGTGAVSASGVAILTTGSLPGGSDSVTAVYSGDTNYASATSNAVIETVGKASGLATLTASILASVFSQPVAFTDTLPVLAGVAPTGTVTFYDGATAIGTGTVNVSGVAVLTTVSLGLGTHSITAVYSGDSSYFAETSNAVTLTVGPNDFRIAATPADQTVDPGVSAVYTLSLAGDVVPFNDAVVLSATGLPPGASVSFTPASLTPGAGPSTATMTIATSPTQAEFRHLSGLSPIGYAVFLLPLLGRRSLRRRFGKLPKGIALLFPFFLIMAGLGTLSALCGCGAGGYFGQPPHSYTIRVTGTSGSLQHATTVTVTVR